MFVLELITMRGLLNC